MEQPNLNYIDSLAGNDTVFRQKLISTIQAELPQEIEEYTDNIAKNDLLRAAGNVHKLKHKISVMGMEKSYYLAETFENNLKAGGTEFKEDFETVLKTMQDFANSL
jgi:HPt (histidine-containing phosphotransfer) domain-containing protein